MPTTTDNDPYKHTQPALPEHWTETVGAHTLPSGAVVHVFHVDDTSAHLEFPSGVIAEISGASRGERHLRILGLDWRLGPTRALVVVNPVLRQWVVEMWTVPDDSPHHELAVSLTAPTSAVAPLVDFIACLPVHRRERDESSGDALVWLGGRDTHGQAVLSRVRWSDGSPRCTEINDCSVSFGAHVTSPAGAPTGATGEQPIRRQWDNRAWYEIPGVHDLLSGDLVGVAIDANQHIWITTVASVTTWISPTDSPGMHHVSLVGIDPEYGPTVALVAVGPTASDAEPGQIEIWDLEQASSGTPMFDATVPDGQIRHLVELLVSLPVRRSGLLHTPGALQATSWMGAVTDDGDAELSRVMWIPGTTPTLMPSGTTAVPRAVVSRESPDRGWFRRAGSHTVPSGFRVTVVERGPSRWSIDLGRGVILDVRDDKGSTDVRARLRLRRRDSGESDAIVSLRLGSAVMPFVIDRPPQRPPHMVHRASSDDDPTFACTLDENSITDIVDIFCRCQVTFDEEPWEWPFPGIAVWRGKSRAPSIASVELIPPNLLAADLHNRSYSIVTELDLTALHRVHR